MATDREIRNALEALVVHLTKRAEKAEAVVAAECSNRRCVMNSA